MTPTMTSHQRVFAIVAAVSLMILIIELVRRRKLKEDYSILWLITGFAVVVLASSYRLQLWLTDLIGAVSSSTTVFGFAFLFLILINLYYSVRLSKMSDQIKAISQELALMKAKGGEDDHSEE